MTVAASMISVSFCHPLPFRSSTIRYSGDAKRSGVLHLLYDGLESGGIVEGEVGEHLAVGSSHGRSGTSAA